jgi:SpoVK/Ycf46/Vps4 family AAA+-type ATPase
MLRILVPLGGLHDLEDSNWSRRLLAGLGIKKCDIDDVFESENKAKIRSTLNAKYAKAVDTLIGARPPAKLVSSVKRLSKLVGLSDVECRLLEFSVLLHSEAILDEAADCLGSISASEAVNALSIILDIPVKKLHKAFQRSGILFRSGLLVLDRDGTGDLCSKLTLISSSFAERILLHEEDPISILQDIIKLCPQPSLALSDYSHLAEQLHILIPYLKRSIQTERRGVNIFLHGPPGTGKTQLARVLAQELVGEIFEVTSQDEDGDPVDGEQRIRSYRAAQCFFAKRSALLMFDEAEDVFSSGFGSKSTAQSTKGWFNAILEGNSVPTIWAANSIEEIDPAFIRRFDLVLELPIPPRFQREKIIRNSCGDMLEEDSIRRLSSSEFLAPAVVTRATSVTRVIKDILPSRKIPGVVEMLINSSLSAQRLPQIIKNENELITADFDPALINTSEDLIEVARGLSDTRYGRLCLYGPPGTGKTAFGRWLADQIGIPLHVKRASDLLSMWIGETEKNIARCFALALKEGALLMLDEVDSFLQDRVKASSSWEVTSVNELLTQVESFQGIFVASTNLMDSLDQASLRRFDLKLMFNYLTQDQAWTLFQRKCAALGFDEPKSKLRVRLQSLECLTPGDFAAVMRRHQFSKVASAEDLITALEAECSVKADQGRKPLGF